MGGGDSSGMRLPVIAVAMAVGVWLSGEVGWAAWAWWGIAAVAAVALGRKGRIVVVAFVAAAIGAQARVAEEAPGGSGIDDRESDTLDGWVSGPITATRAGVMFVIEVGEARVQVVAERHGGVLPGERVRVVGRVVSVRGYRNPGAADRVVAAQARGAMWEVRARSVERMGETRMSAWRWPAAIARAASERVAVRGGDAEGNALVRAAVLGDRSALDEDTDAAWRAAGVFHALSVSGLHLAAVTVVVFVVVGWLWAMSGMGVWMAPRRAAAAIALPAALLYTLVTGAQIATVRALLVVAVVLVGELIARRVRAADALGLAAIAVLAVSPLALYDPGFQLSFVAAATLIVAAAGGRGEAPEGPWPWRAARAIGRGLRTSFAVALATAPITAWHFHEISLGGVIGNLIVTPLVELVTIPVGLAGLMIGAAWEGGGGVVLDGAIAIAGWTADIVDVLAGWTPSLRVPPPGRLELVACAGLYAAWALVATGRVSARIALAGAVAATLVLTGSWAWRAHARVADDTLRITFLDVGQGDAAVIELPGGEVWIVDAGGAPGLGDLRAVGRPGEQVARYLRARRVPRIAVAVVSHPHPDHHGGLAAVGAHLPIDTLWSAEEPAAEEEATLAPRDRRAVEGDAGFRTLVAWLRRRGTVHVHPALGVHRRGDVTVRVLGPRHDPGDGAWPHAAADPVRSINDNSLVLTVERAGRCVLFTGDLEAEGEQALVDGAGGALPCDVVKVAHHGSRTSSSPALVAATRPAWAVISLGRGNRFGFPDPGVVARWQAAGAGVLRTDEAGAVTVTIDRAGALQIATQDQPAQR